MTRDTTTTTSARRSRTTSTDSVLPTRRGTTGGGGRGTTAPVRRGTTQPEPRGSTTLGYFADFVGRDECFDHAGYCMIRDSTTCAVATLAVASSFTSSSSATELSSATEPPGCYIDCGAIFTIQRIVRTIIPRLQREDRQYAIRFPPDNLCTI